MKTIENILKKLIFELNLLIKINIDKISIDPTCIEFIIKLKDILKDQIHTDEQTNTSNKSFNIFNKPKTYWDIITNEYNKSTSSLTQLIKKRKEFFTQKYITNFSNNSTIENIMKKKKQSEKEKGIDIFNDISSIIKKEKEKEQKGGAIETTIKEEQKEEEKTTIKEEEKAEEKKEEKEEKAEEKAEEKSEEKKAATSQEKREVHRIILQPEIIIPKIKLISDERYNQILNTLTPPIQTVIKTVTCIGCSAHSIYVSIRTTIVKIFKGNIDDILENKLFGINSPLYEILKTEITGILNKYETTIKENFSAIIFDNGLIKLVPLDTTKLEENKKFAIQLKQIDDIRIINEDIVEKYFQDEMKIKYPDIIQKLHKGGKNKSIIKRQRKQRKHKKQKTIKNKKNINKNINKNNAI